MSNNKLRCTFPMAGSRSPLRSSKVKNYSKDASSQDSAKSTLIGGTMVSSKSVHGGLCSIAQNLTTVVSTSGKEPQDINEIKRQILGKRRNGPVPVCELFVDSHFPPDITSLTYVYSGDDKYERMVFKRPHDLHPRPYFSQPHGRYPIHHPFRRWNNKQWFLHTIAVISLNPVFMERVVVHWQDQSFSRNYTGAFVFALWRFGDWVKVIVDDFLPTLDGELAFCAAFGNPPVFWPALLEKAYAKCNKAYEAIEMCHPLVALTDFTGAVCEHYSPNESANSEKLFWIIYKSSINRSQLVCWRSQKSFAESTFRPVEDYSGSPQDYSKCSSLSHMLFIITAVTKFPLRDGRMLEMVRLKCPHDPGVTWWGDFSVKNDMSWHTVNPSFVESYKPRACLQRKEFWMPYFEFCRHFSDLVVCSSAEPYRGFGAPRYLDASETPPESTEIDAPTTESTIYGTNEQNNKDYLDVPTGDRLVNKHDSIEITVQEGLTTIKMDTVEEQCHQLDMKREASFGPKREMSVHARRKSTCKTASGDRRESDGVNRHQDGKICITKNKITIVCDNNSSTYVEATVAQSAHHNGSESNGKETRSSASSASRRESIYATESLEAVTKPCGPGCGPTSVGAQVSIDREDIRTSNRSRISNVSNTSLSDTESTNSASEVTIRLKSSQSRRQYTDRPSSAPAKSPRRQGISTSKNSTKYFDSSLFEVHVDHFRPSGTWRLLVQQSGGWNKKTSGGPASDMTAHSRNPRIGFELNKSDAVTGISPPRLHGKCHILISLLQGCRRGPKVVNSKPVDVGFRLYKSKIPEKDEKRHLSKLVPVCDSTSLNQCREITARLDLEPGYYILVPYTYHVGQEGGFLVRILGEEDHLSGKTGCVPS